MPPAFIYIYFRLHEIFVQTSEEINFTQTIFEYNKPSATHLVTQGNQSKMIIQKLQFEYKYSLQSFDVPFTHEQ